ncbi:DUF4157 domain-containing protein [Streptomyces sp. WELS2]
MLRRAGRARAELENRLGADFPGVRVHSDAVREAATSTPAPMSRRR